MNRTIIRASLLSALLLIVAAAGTAKSTTLQAQELVGLFGEVTGITTPSSGLYELTLVTTTKDVQRVVATDENTSVTIPGRERAQPADISLGDFLAVLAGGADNRLEAVRILVKPNRAVVHAHITGSLVGAVGEQVSIMDRVGNVVTADVFLEGKGIDPAEVVTAVVRQDIKTGGLSILAAQPADANITRLAIALQSAVDTGATENRENLGSRLRASTTGHLTTLQEILYRVGPDLGFFYTQALERTLRSHEERLATFDLGAPTVKLAGFIQDIDRPRGIISVSQQEGPQVQLKLTAETTIRLFGVDVHPENLSTGQHAGQRIESVYDPQTGEAHTINVIVPVLGDNLVGSLLAQARMGELEGTVTAVVPPAVVVTLATDMPFRLTTTPDTRIRVEERPADLQRLFLGARVKVRYDPSTIQALAIDTFDENPGQEFISGVVKSLKPQGTEYLHHVPRWSDRNSEYTRRQDRTGWAGDTQRPYKIWRPGQAHIAIQHWDPRSRETGVEGRGAPGSGDCTGEGHHPWRK